MDYYAERDYNKLCVCPYCIQAIEAHEGRQRAVLLWVDETDEISSKCDWCEESGYDELYQIG